MKLFICLQVPSSRGGARNQIQWRRGVGVGGDQKEVEEREASRWGRQGYVLWVEQEGEEGSLGDSGRTSFL